MENNLIVLEGLVALRGWCKSNLPTEDSLVAYDIILLVAISHLTKSPLKVKHLFDSLPHSYTAVRYHYLRLISDDWLAHDTDEKDKRIKLIRATDKFVNTINNYVGTINAALSSSTLTPMIASPQP